MSRRELQSGALLRILVAACMAACCATTARAWELLVTTQGADVSGDVSQNEFVFTDAAGSEFVVPRAAASRFDAEEGGLRVLIKDGTIVRGTLQGKLEIEDGMIKRRFAGEEILRVEFDRFIAPEPGKSYDSCPIRIEYPASPALYNSDRVSRPPGGGRVTCQGGRIVSVTFRRNKDLKPGKEFQVSADFIVDIPNGNDQLVDLRLQLMQGERLVLARNARWQADEGKTDTKTITLALNADMIDPAGPPPKFQVQMVRQDAEVEVQKGGFFWWFTIPLG